MQRLSDTASTRVAGGKIHGESEKMEKLYEVKVELICKLPHVQLLDDLTLSLSLFLTVKSSDTPKLNLCPSSLFLAVITSGRVQAFSGNHEQEQAG